MANKLVRNEQQKLTATYLNGAAVAVLGVGGFAPVVALAQSSNPSIAAIFVVFGCLVASAGLHWLARGLLGGLEE